MTNLTDEQRDKLHSMMQKDKLWRTTSGLYGLRGHNRKRVGLSLAGHFIFNIGFAILAGAIIAGFVAIIATEILPLLLEVDADNLDLIWWAIWWFFAVTGWYFMLPDQTLNAWNQSLSILEEETLKAGTFWLRDDFDEQRLGDE